jgi:hypothetical protein
MAENANKMAANLWVRQSVMIAVYADTIAYGNFERMGEPLKSQVLINGVVSRGRCNTSLQFIRWSVKSQRFSWPLI